MRILYLEDEPNEASLVERYIQATPHQLTLVEDVENAREALSDNPDLILVDVLLNKERRGYDFVRDLRAQHYMQPVIAITGLTLPRDLEQCYESGCNDVLTKPYKITQLAALIQKYSS